MTVKDWDADTARTTNAVCPFCDYKIDAATCFENPEARPAPGSLSICIMCAQVVFYTVKLALRRPYVGELEVVMQDEKTARTIRKVQYVIRQLDRRRKN